MASITFEEIVNFIRHLYGTDDFIPLHHPRFDGMEKIYLEECIDSTFVSSVGKFVDLFEKKISEFTGAKHAVAVVNGTQALFIALQLCGVDKDTEVITQALTFVATANAIHYTGAALVFLDVDVDTMGLSPDALRRFLEKNSYQKEKKCWNKETGKQIKACVPMHTFGHPCRVEEIRKICSEFHLTLIEDSAESLGSYLKRVHTGCFGEAGILSFNGNKIITTGGGGMIITDNDPLAAKAKHLTTTAKLPHPWEFNHDTVGYNYRLPNLNAALGVAQMQQLPKFLRNKRKLAKQYSEFFEGSEINFKKEPTGSQSNYWLNSIEFSDRKKRDDFLEFSNNHGIMTRCLWTPMHRLSMYRECQKDGLQNTDWLFDRIVNLPSSSIA